jgi:hypothetical protein
MKRRTVTVFMILCVLALALPALAAEVKFSNFSTTLPNGWTHKEDKGVAYLYSPAKECGVMILFRNANGKSEKAFAEDLAKIYNGDTPEQIGGYSNYGFNATIDGMEASVTTGVENSMGFMFAEMGAYDNYQDEINEQIWNGMKSADPKVKALIDTLVAE